MRQPKRMGVTFLEASNRVETEEFGQITIEITVGVVLEFSFPQVSVFILVFLDPVYNFTNCRY